MYSKFIEVHLRNQGAEAGDQIIVNVGKITVIRDGVVETEREGIEVTETYDELKALIYDSGCLIHKADPRLDTEHPLTMEDLEKWGLAKR